METGGESWGPKPDVLLHHSDRGSQYTTEQFQKLMADHGIGCSMPRSGNVWDNAAMESFFSLKTERTARKTYRTRDEARADVFAVRRETQGHRRAYVDPPAHAVVPSVDEKSQIQALDRTHPSLPMKSGRTGTMTHDYKRHGTTTLFAALNVLDGTVIGHNIKRHRHQEFILFLDTIEAKVPKRKTIHAIIDNYATHKHPKVRAWLARHRRWTFQFTSTSASWLNAVETFFAKLTRRRLQRGVFRSLEDLKTAINRFVAETNADPKPFVWAADPRRVLAAVKRGKQALESVH